MMPEVCPRRCQLSKGPNSVERRIEMRRNSSWRICLAISFLALCQPATNLDAQEVTPLAIDDALKTTSFGETSPFSLSRDGKWLAFMAVENQRNQSVMNDEHQAFVRTGVATRYRAGNIWIAEVDSNKIRNLTGNVGSNWDPTWSPDGRYLAFVSDRDGSGQARLWVWNSSKDELKKVSDANVRGWLVFNRLKWAPDSKKIFFTTIPQGLSTEKYFEDVDGLRIDRSPDTSAAAAPKVYKSNADTVEGAETSAVNLGGVYLHDLSVVDITSGKVARIAGGHLIKWFEPSPDGRRMAYAALKGFHRKQTCDLIEVDLATMQERVLTSDTRFDAFSWSPDSSAIAYGAHHGESQAYDYFLVALGDGTERRVSSLSGARTWCCEQGNPVWDATGESFYFLHDGALWRTRVAEGKTAEIARIPNRTMRFRTWQGDQTIWSSDGGKSTVVVAYDDEHKQDGFYRVDLDTGQTTALLERGKCYSCKWGVDVDGYIVSASENGRFAYIAESAGRAPDLWVSDSEFKHPREITHLNPQLEKYKMGAARVIDWLSDDGVRLHGALLLPSDYREGQRYPLIVWTYPGSWRSHYFDSFGFGEFPGPLNAQLLATRGYAVLYADAPWKKEEPSLSLVKTVLPGVNKVIELGIADSERVGLIGHSAGGYSTLLLLTETNRFKAAIEASGFGDLVSGYGVMREDGSASMYMTVEAFVGDVGPWHDPIAYLEGSPVFRYDRISTPLLIIHGSKDRDVASFLADEVFVDLRTLGKNVEYARYENEGHVPTDWSFAHQSDVANRVIAWFDGHLR